MGGYLQMAMVLVVVMMDRGSSSQTAIQRKRPKPGTGTKGHVIRSWLRPRGEGRRGKRCSHVMDACFLGARLG